MADKRPIIIIKKKSGHAAHHGGAWKVAYADFVTAMMALFIVLWLTSSGEKVRKSIAGYFNDPSGKSSTPGTDDNGGDSIPLNKESIKSLKERLQKQIAQRYDLKPLANQIEIAITPEGMRIELIESKDGSFFESGSSVLNANGKELLQLLAKELGGVPNRVSMEGHTDAQPYNDQTRYDNWELSTDRANAARRVMQATGLHLGQVSQVRGFADQQLRVPSNPLDPSNRRITVIVHYLEAPPRMPTGFAAKPGADGKPGPAAPAPAAPGKPGTVPSAPLKNGPLPAPASPAQGKETGIPANAKPSAPEGSGGKPDSKQLLAKPSAIHAMLNKLPSVPPGATPGALMGKFSSLFKHKPAKTAEGSAPEPPEAAAKGPTAAGKP